MLAFFTLCLGGPSSEKSRPQLVRGSSHFRHCSWNSCRSSSFCPWNKNLARGVSSAGGLADAELTSGLTWLPVQKHCGSSDEWSRITKLLWMSLDLCQSSCFRSDVAVKQPSIHPFTRSAVSLSRRCEVVCITWQSDLLVNTSRHRLVLSSVQSNDIMLEELLEEKHCAAPQKHHAGCARSQRLQPPC